MVRRTGVGRRRKPHLEVMFLLEAFTSTDSEIPLAGVQVSITIIKNASKSYLDLPF